jgi:hypothetical protein
MVTLNFPRQSAPHWQWAKSRTRGKEIPVEDQPQPGFNHVNRIVNYHLTWHDQPSLAHAARLMHADPSSTVNSTIPSEDVAQHRRAGNRRRNSAHLTFAPPLFFGIQQNWPLPTSIVRPSPPTL